MVAYTQCLTGVNEMPFYTVCSMSGELGFDVHDANCADVKRGLILGRKYHGGHTTNANRNMRQYSQCWTYEAKSAEDVVKSEISDLNHDFGKGVWTSDFFHIMPCTKK